MSRPLKFRAWDKTNNHLFYPDEEGNFDRVIHGARVGSDFTYRELFSGIYKHLIPLQFTGLKDKKGVEIYEGDILCVHEENGEDYTHSVEWGGDYPAFTLKPSTEAEYNDLQHACTVVSCEVVGNIYQTPELTQQS